MEISPRIMTLLLLTVIFMIISCSDRSTGPSIFNLPGDGTESNPYRISGPEHLKVLAQSVNSGNSHEGEYFRITSDIDLSRYQSGEGWMPIGHIMIHRDDYTLPGSSHPYSNDLDLSSSDSVTREEYWEEYPFQGFFDGGGNTIIGLSINRPDSSFIGLFGFIENGKIENIRLSGVDIIGQAAVGGLVGLNRASTIFNSSVEGSIVGEFTVGGLVGDNFSHSSVSDCYTDGSVFSAVIGVGGLIGRSTSYSTITNCYSKAAVKGNEWVGGLIGLNVHDSSVVNSYASGPVTGNNTVGGLIGLNRSETEILNSYNTAMVEGGQKVGGLVGESSITTISNCYNTGNVSGVTDVGGLIGYIYDYTVLSYSYSAGSVSGSSYAGGFVGSVDFSETNIITNCYWDMEASGQYVSAVGEGRTTTEMIYPYGDETYTNWEFGTLWLADQDHHINNGYPYLFWQ